jgi:surface protein
MSACELKLFLKKLNDYEPGIYQQIYKISIYIFTTKRELQDAIFEHWNYCTDDILKYGHISLWDTSQLTDMSYLFSFKECIQEVLTDDPHSFGGGADEAYDYYLCAKDFNENINTWDVSNVKTMKGMFDACENFNQPLEKWDVSNVKTMKGMFNSCENFNQPLEKWDVYSVKTMKKMFNFCKKFNQPLNSWDVSNVENMDWMFWNCNQFNQPLNTWNVYNVKNMEHMFNDKDTFIKLLNMGYALWIYHGYT